MKDDVEAGPREIPMKDQQDDVYPREVPKRKPLECSARTPNFLEAAWNEFMDFLAVSGDWKLVEYYLMSMSRGSLMDEFR